MNFGNFQASVLFSGLFDVSKVLSVSFSIDCSFSILETLQIVTKFKMQVYIFKNISTVRVCLMKKLAN